MAKPISLSATPQQIRSLILQKFDNSFDVILVEKHLDRHEDEVIDLRNQLARRDDVIADLEQKKDDLYVEIEGLEADVHRLNAEIERLRAENLTF